VLAFLSIFVNWYILGLVIALAAVAALIYFTQGPATLVKVALDARTWMGVGVAVAFLTLYSSSQTIQRQQTEIATTTTDKTAGDNSQAVVTDVVVKKQGRQKQAEAQQTVIEQAKPGDAVDDLMDEFAQEDAEAAKK